MKTLKELTKKEFNKLKEIGMLYEIYPNAPETYKELKNMYKPNISLIDDNILNLEPLKELLSDLISDYKIDKNFDDIDIKYVFTKCLKTFYGENIFDELKKI